MGHAYYRLQRAVSVDNTNRLRADLLAVVNASHGDVIIDCVHLEFIDTIGVAVISQIRRLLTVHARRLRLTNLSSHLRRPFELLGHSDYLEVRETEVRATAGAES